MVQPHPGRAAGPPQGSHHTRQVSLEMEKPSDGTPRKINKLGKLKICWRWQEGRREEDLSGKSRRGSAVAASANRKISGQQVTPGPGPEEKAWMHASHASLLVPE